MDLGRSAGAHLPLVVRAASHTSVVVVEVVGSCVVAVVVDLARTREGFASSVQRVPDAIELS